MSSIAPLPSDSTLDLIIAEATPTGLPFLLKYTDPLVPNQP